MNLKLFLLFVARSLDPKKTLEETAPRPMLLAKGFIEYIFKIAGFFILLCLVVGLTLASCPSNYFLATMPFMLGIAFCFYLALTTIGLPVFMLISEMKDVKLRRITGYLTVLVMLVLTFYTFLASPIFDLLLEYVGRLFPSAFTCESSLIPLDF